MWHSVEAPQVVATGRGSSGAGPAACGACHDGCSVRGGVGSAGLEDQYTQWHNWDNWCLKDFFTLVGGRAVSVSTQEEWAARARGQGGKCMTGVPALTGTVRSLPGALAGGAWLD